MTNVVLASRQTMYQATSTLQLAIETPTPTCAASSATFYLGVGPAEFITEHTLSPSPCHPTVTEVTQPLLSNT